jgi:hypothetical protein
MNEIDSHISSSGDEDVVPLPPPATTSFIAVETHKRMNLGTTIRCGVAFAIDNLVVIGSPKFGTHGAHGSHKYIDAMHYFYWDNFFADMKSQGVTTVGISPRILAPSTSGGSSSKTLDSIRFTQGCNYAFVLDPPNSQSYDGGSILRRCDHILHVNYPLGPAANEFILYDASVSLVLLKLRTDTNTVPHAFSSEKFLLAEAPRRHGVRTMDAERVGSIDPEFLEVHCDEEDQGKRTCGDQVDDAVDDVLLSWFGGGF